MLNSYSYLMLASSIMPVLSIGVLNVLSFRGKPLRIRTSLVPKTVEVLEVCELFVKLELFVVFIFWNYWDFTTRPSSHCGFILGYNLQFIC